MLAPRAAFGVHARRWVLACAPLQQDGSQDRIPANPCGSHGIGQRRLPTPVRISARCVRVRLAEVQPLCCWAPSPARVFNTKSRP